MSRLLVMLISIVFLLGSASSVSAEECAIVYGGGEIDCSSTPTPKADNNKPTAVPTKAPVNNNQTKGGLPVQEVSKTDTTPATGPEAFGLISLVPLAAAGWYLRKKAK